MRFLAAKRSGPNQLEDGRPKRGRRCGMRRGAALWMAAAGGDGPDWGSRERRQRSRRACAHPRRIDDEFWGRYPSADPARDGGDRGSRRSPSRSGSERYGGASSPFLTTNVGSRAWVLPADPEMVGGDRGGRRSPSSAVECAIRRRLVTLLEL